MKMQFLYIISLFIIGCSSNSSDEPNPEINKSEFSAPIPKELRGIPKELIVKHNVDTVYATINTKDPEKWGKYQLQFTTTVTSPKESVKITEFGGYLLEDNKWVFKSIYKRPFNSEEFEKWYNSPNAILEVGEKYSDNDNWLGKTNRLNGRTVNCLWYFKGVTKNGKEVIGISEVVGIYEMK